MGSRLTPKVSELGGKSVIYNTYAQALHLPVNGFLFACACHCSLSSEEVSTVSTFTLIFPFWSVKRILIKTIIGQYKYRSGGYMG